jgi:hypothetical protein
MLVTPQDVTKFTPRLSPRAEQYEGTRLVFRIGPRSSSGSAFPIESGSDFGSPALLMILSRRPAQFSRFSRRFLVVRDRRRAAIIKSAGEPVSGVVSSTLFGSTHEGIMDENRPGPVGDVTRNER